MAAVSSRYNQWYNLISGTVFRIFRDFSPLSNFSIKDIRNGVLEQVSSTSFRFVEVALWKKYYLELGLKNFRRNPFFNEIHELSSCFWIFINQLNSIRLISFCLMKLFKHKSIFRWILDFLSFRNVRERSRICMQRPSTFTFPGQLHY